MNFWTNYGVLEKCGPAMMHKMLGASVKRVGWTYMLLPSGQPKEQSVAGRVLEPLQSTVALLHQ